MDSYHNPHCIECQNDKLKYRENNLCSNFMASDNQVARCASYWTEQKIKIVEDYSGILTVGMKNRFKQINYIDLFSGPGIYFDRESGIEKTGSAISVINYGYSNVYLNDLDVKCYNALLARTKNATASVTIFNKDANSIGKSINDALDPNSLSFCLLDPSKMSELNFHTIKELTNNRLIDLLINFPIGMDFKRGAKVTNNKYDKFFNSNRWKEIYQSHENKDIMFLGEELINLYLNELYNIGYARPKIDEKYKNYFPIKMQRNVLLYYLIFVSKHERGYEFCSKIRKYVNPQQELFN